VHGDGLQTRDFTFVGTVAEIITCAVQDKVSAAGPVNLAFGTRVSLLELLDVLSQKVGGRIKRVHIARPG